MGRHAWEGQGRARGAKQMKGSGDPRTEGGKEAWVRSTVKKLILIDEISTVHPDCPNENRDAGCRSALNGNENGGEVTIA